MKYKVTRKGRITRNKRNNEVAHYREIGRILQLEAQVTIPNRPWILYLLSAGERVGMHRFETEEGAMMYGDACIEAGQCGGYEHFFQEAHPAKLKDQAEGRK